MPQSCPTLDPAGHLSTDTPTKIAFVYPYYESRVMLELQLKEWQTYDSGVLGQVKFIIVDDGSPTHPALPLVKGSGLPLSLYRIRENIPWNQHGARNLGATVAHRHIPNAWMLMSDLDLVVRAEMIKRVLTRALVDSCHYTFERVFFAGERPRKVHWNSFLVRSGVFWKAGGYDEDYCGTYGGDAPFLQALRNIAPRRHMADVELVNYTAVTVRDAQTTAWSRDGHYHEQYERLRSLKMRLGRTRPQNPLRFQWERQL